MVVLFNLIIIVRWDISPRPTVPSPTFSGTLLTLASSTTKKTPMCSTSPHSRRAYLRDCRFITYRRRWSLRREWNRRLWSQSAPSYANPLFLKSSRSATRGKSWTTTPMISRTTSASLHNPTSVTTCCSVTKLHPRCDRRWWIGWSKSFPPIRCQRKPSSRAYISWTLSWNIVVLLLRWRIFIWSVWLPCSSHLSTRRFILWSWMWSMIRSLGKSSRRVRYCNARPKLWKPSSFLWRILQCMIL